MCIETRLEHLERQLAQSSKTNRRLIVGFIAVAFIGTGATWSAAVVNDAAEPKEIHANRFVVDDEQGRAIATLCANTAGDPAIYLMDKKGKTRVAISLMADGGGLIGVVDEEGNPRASFGIVHGTEPALALHSAEGNTRALLFVTKEGHPGLSLTEGEGKGRTALSSPHNGGLSITDEAGKTRITLGADDNGINALRIADAQGDTRLLAIVDDAGPIGFSVTKEPGKVGTFLGVTQGKWPTIKLFGAKQSGATLSLRKDGRPGLLFTDEAAKVRAELSLNADWSPSLQFFKPDGETSLYKVP